MKVKTFKQRNPGAIVLLTNSNFRPKTMKTEAEKVRKKDRWDRKAKFKGTDQSDGPLLAA